mgnify:FL=1|jgi:hypothetical protein
MPDPKKSPAEIAKQREEERRKKIEAARAAAAARAPKGRNSMTGNGDL